MRGRGPGGTGLPGTGTAPLAAVSPVTEKRGDDLSEGPQHEKMFFG